jgi:hypothetical protein
MEFFLRKDGLFIEILNDEIKRNKTGFKNTWGSRDTHGTMGRTPEF